MEIDSGARAFDGTRIYPLGKDVFIGVQWFNGDLSYILRVSSINILSIFLISIIFINQSFMSAFIVISES